MPKFLTDQMLNANWLNLLINDIRIIVKKKWIIILKSIYFTLIAILGTKFVHLWLMNIYNYMQNSFAKCIIQQESGVISAQKWS